MRKDRIREEWNEAGTVRMRGEMWDAGVSVGVGVSVVECGMWECGEKGSGDSMEKEKKVRI